MLLLRLSTTFSLHLLVAKLIFTQQKQSCPCARKYALSTDSIVLLSQRLAIIFYDLKYGQCPRLTRPRALSLPYLHGANGRVFS
uniref:Putative secreted protein n=1 Tax=Anopheles marajoara TaxID=58244 RepID=A0A2M4CBA7_9DIPT